MPSQETGSCNGNYNGRDKRALINRTSATMRNASK